MYFCISASLFPAKKSVTVFDTVAVAVSGNTMASRLIFISFANNATVSKFNLNDGTDAHVQIICQCPLGKVPLCSGSTEGSSKRINWILHFNSPHI